jgi:hypothetical protein
VLLEIFTPPVAGALVAVLEVGGVLAGVDVLDFLLEPPHPAITSATANGMRTAGSLLNETSLSQLPEGRFRAYSQLGTLKPGLTHHQPDRKNAPRAQRLLAARDPARRR